MKIRAVLASAKYKLRVATQMLMQMDHVPLVGLMREWAAIPQMEQLASMNHLLAQTVLESALQEHAYATQSVAMGFRIPGRTVIWDR